MRILPVIIILIGLFIFAFIFDHRQDFIYENTDNDYDSDSDKYDLDLIIPNNAMIPNKDIFNDFRLYEDYEVVVDKPYKFLSDSKITSSIISSRNATCMVELTNNYEKGFLLGCYVLWFTSNNFNISKTLRISLLKENKSIIIFQETTTYKPFNKKFSESYTILDNISIRKEIIIIEIFFEQKWIDGVDISEIYLLVISNNDLYPEVIINQLEVFFFLDIQLYYDNKKIIKFFLFVFSLIFYIHFYFRLNKKMKKFLIKTLF